jgi:hypothetical protein
MDNVQNCDSYINIPSSQTDSINLLGSQRRRNVFAVRYGLYLCVPYGSHSKQH